MDGEGDTRSWRIALAVLLAAIAGIDGVNRFVSDHNNFGDVNFLAFAAACLALAAWAALNVGLLGLAIFLAVVSSPAESAG